MTQKPDYKDFEIDEPKRRKIVSPQFADRVITKTQKKISNLIYKELDYMYCDNCRFRSEITEEQSRKKYGSYRCEDCHRKYNGWGVSRTVADQLAEKICKEVNRSEIKDL